MTPVLHTAKKMWQLTPCGIATHKVAIPLLQGGTRHLKRAVAPTTPTPHDKRPLRQRFCRFVFKEFVRSCGLGSGFAHLQSYHLWQAAFVVGVLAVVAVRI
jgi:hypothetical protein